MKNRLTQAVVTALAFSLAACGGSGSGDNAPTVSAEEALQGATFVGTGQPLRFNNLKNADPEKFFKLEGLDTIQSYGMTVPLPEKKMFYVNGTTPYVVDGKSYQAFVVSGKDEYPDSRFAYLRYEKSKKDIVDIYAFSGVSTQDMPQSGTGNYQGRAIHTFDLPGKHYITDADASAQVDFGKKELTVSITPKANAVVPQSAPFNFAAQFEGNAFNGKNTYGSQSEDGKRSGRQTITATGQFNGSAAAEMVGQYHIEANSFGYPNGAEGVFGLKKQ